MAKSPTAVNCGFNPSGVASSIYRETNCGFDPDAAPARAAAEEKLLLARYPEIKAEADRYDAAAVEKLREKVVAAEVTFNPLVKSLYNAEAKASKSREIHERSPRTKDRPQDTQTFKRRRASPPTR